jgi:polyhydroxyalkanoate synthesis regulator phasin
VVQVLKNKAILLSLLAIVIAAAIGVGVAGCASKSQPAANAPSTNGGSAPQSGQSNSSHQFNPQQMQASIKTALSSLVTKGTITQDQSDKVVQAYAQAFANRQQGSGQQGSGYQQGSGQQGSGQQGASQRSNPIVTQLVSNGTLTQSQADAVNQAIRSAMPHRRPVGSTSGQTSSGGSTSGQTTTQ